MIKPERFCGTKPLLLGTDAKGAVAGAAVR